MNDYLAHHGIKGQKWGIRRYQNPDGSFTDAGRKRYISKNGYLSEKGEKLLYDQNGRLTEGGKKFYSNEAKRIVDPSQDSSGAFYNIRGLRYRAEQSPEIKKITDRARKINSEMDEAYNKWEMTADFSGMDDASSQWSKYVEKTPALKAKSEEIDKLSWQFRDASHKYLDSLLDDYGRQPIENINNNVNTVMDVLMDGIVYDDFFDIVYG